MQHNYFMVILEIYQEKMISAVMETLTNSDIVFLILKIKTLSKNFYYLSIGILF